MMGIIINKQKLCLAAAALIMMVCAGCGGGSSTVSLPTTGTVAGYVYVPMGSTARIRAFRVANAAPAGYKPLEGATVTVVGASLLDTTDSTGRYEIESVSIGTHQLTVSATGYETTTIENVTVTGGVTTTVGGDSGSQIYTEQKGSIQISWTPSDIAVDSVKIDGETTGFSTSPVTLQNVCVASHTIIITKTGYSISPVSQVVAVTDGTTAQISFTLTSTAPAITDFTPQSGPIGTSVTITGANFGSTQGSSAVKFNDVSATCGSWSATSLTCTVPTGTTSGTITVTTSEGSTTSTSSFSVTTKIVFNTKPTTGNRQIVAIDPDGSNRTEITDGTYDDHAPAWSPDGTQIAFCSNRTNDTNDSVYVMDADGANVSKVKEISGEDCDEVEWSPDGTMLTFATKIGDFAITYKAYKIGVDGSGLADLGEGYYVLWNSGGTKIFKSNPSNSYKLTSIDPDGTDAAAVTEFSYFPQEISPDGTKMLFGGGSVPEAQIVGGTGGGDKSGLFYGNSDGSGSYTLIFENVSSPMELYCDIGCSWSPDGTQIVYDKYDVSTGLSIYVANLDGSGATQLTTEAVSPDWK